MIKIYNAYEEEIYQFPKNSPAQVPWDLKTSYGESFCYCETEDGERHDNPTWDNDKEVAAEKNRLERLLDEKTGEATLAGFSYDGEVFSTSLPAQGNWRSVEAKAEKKGDDFFPKTVNVQGRKQYTFQTKAEFDTFADEIQEFIDNEIVDVGGTEKVKLEACADTEESTAWEKMKAWRDANL
jgi:hypothetical protein